MCEKMIDLLLENCPLFLNVGFWARLPLSQCWSFCAMSSIRVPEPPAKINIEREGSGAAEKLCQFSNKKTRQNRWTNDFWTQNTAKKHSFSNEAGADLEPLNRPCFHWSSRAQKSGSHSRHAGGHFLKILSVFISFLVKIENTPPQKSTLRERGGARRRNYVNFPIRKWNKIDEQNAKHRKKRTFLDEAGAEMERLNPRCFLCSAGPKKAAPIVDMLGGPFRKFQAFSYHFESKVRISFANINIEREGRSAAEKLYQFSNKKRYRIDEETFLGRKIPQRTYF